MKSRLSKTDWLNHGLKILAQSGYPALKADSLAKALNVSRGSFYWHFKDVSQFHQILLLQWRARATDQIIAEVELLGAGDLGLKALMRKAMCADDRLERAIRTWAIHSAIAAEAVRGVDQARLDYLCKLLKSAGVAEQHIVPRAAFIYWANLGRSVTLSGSNTLSPNQLEAIADLFLS